MRDMVQTLVTTVVIVGLVIAGLKLYKNRHSVRYDPGDSSMMGDDFPSGKHFSIEMKQRPEDLVVGDIVAHNVPEDPIPRFARVVGTPGQKVSAIKGVIKNNGQATAFNLEHSEVSLPEFTVPRGCLYLLADISSSTQDSRKLGPIPFHRVIGKVK